MSGSHQHADSKNAGQRLDDALHFVSRFITRPGSVGSIWPSSQELGEAMIDAISLQPGDVVVEYGPGTGSFTRVLQERMPAGVEYLGIEFDPEFHRNLVRRFPGMRFHHGSAEETHHILASHGLGAARLVISGLPFANMPPTLQERILEATREALHHDGTFRTFSYLFASINPRTKHFRRKVKEHFHEHHHTKTVVRNFPPARVLTYSKPVRKK
jgi:phospholipid N-methyltransferase